MRLSLLMLFSSPVSRPSFQVLVETIWWWRAAIRRFGSQNHLRWRRKLMVQKLFQGFGFVLFSCYIFFFFPPSSIVVWFFFVSLCSRTEQYYLASQCQWSRERTESISLTCFNIFFSFPCFRCSFSFFSISLLYFPLSPLLSLSFSCSLIGSNLGISLSEDGTRLQFQNRSHFVNSATQAQWRQLDSWADMNRASLYSILSQGEGRETEREADEEKEKERRELGAEKLFIFVCHLIQS